VQCAWKAREKNIKKSQRFEVDLFLVNLVFCILGGGLDRRRPPVQEEFWRCMMSNPLLFFLFFCLSLSLQ
jgi:hypothetical protein